MMTRFATCAAFLALATCSSLDTDFRSRVQSASLGVSGERDGDGTSRGTVTEMIVFRKDGVR